MADHKSGLIVACALASFLACAPEDGPSYYVFHEAEHEGITVPDLDSRSATGPGWTAGPEIPLHEIGRIGVVRVWGDTLVGVFDVFACQIHLLRLRGDETVEPLRRFGRCGDGPGELRGVDDLYLDGDTLIAVDHDQNLLRLFSTTSDGVRSLPLNATREDSWRALDLLLASEAELTFHGTVAAMSRESYGFIRRLARDDGRRLADALSEAPGAVANPAPFLRRLFVCADPDTQRLVVANRWRVERAILTPEFDVAAGPFRSELDWVVERPYEDRPGVRPNAFVRVACGRGRALLQWRVLTDGNTIDHYYLEILDIEGRVLHQEQGRGPGSDHPSSQAVAGGVVGGWLTYTNDSELGPALRVFRLK